MAISSKLGYVYAPVGEPLRSDLITWAAQHLPDDKLDLEGREANPHITLVHGIHPDATVEDARHALRQWLRTPRVKLQTTIAYAQYFKHSHRSVLVLLCESAPFEDITRNLNAYFNLKYRLNAHVTLAYLRKGQEVSVRGALAFVHRAVTSNCLVFVDTNRQHHELRFR